jgi:hypothetical protein
VASVEERHTCRTFVRNPEGRDHVDDLCGKGRILLEVYPK